MSWSALLKPKQRLARSHLLDWLTEAAGPGGCQDEGPDRRFTGQAGLFIHRASGVVWCDSNPRITPFEALRLYQPAYTAADTLAWIEARLAAHPAPGSSDPDYEDDDEQSAAQREYRAMRARDAIERSEPITPGTTVWRHLEEQRGINPQLCDPDHFRLLRHAATGDDGFLAIAGSHQEPTSVETTYIDAHGHKSARKTPRIRWCLQRNKPHTIALPGVPGPQGETIVVEGAPDGLSVASLPGEQRPILILLGIGELSRLTVPGKNRTYIIVRDGDPPNGPADKALRRGIDHLILQGATVRVTDTPLKADANSILVEHGPDALAALIANATEHDLTDEGEVKRLAKIDDPFEFRLERKRVKRKHKHLDVKFIDEAVADIRAKADAETAVKATGLDAFANEQPWPEPVDADVVLDEIEALIHRHVVVPEYAAVQATAWIVHTHIVHHPVIQIPISPRFAAQGLTEDSGKSVLLRVMQPLTPRPFSMSSMTGATLFRIMDRYRPTLFVHEIDEVLKSNDPGLISILNGAHSRAEAMVPRCSKDGAGNIAVDLYSSWGALAASGIGRLKPTVQSRFIAVRMKPATNEELVQIEHINLAKMDKFVELRRKLARIAADLKEADFDLDPPMPGAVNRGADNWRVLLGCAGIAGARWFDKVETAMLAAFRAPKPLNDLQQLLTGIRNAFDRRAGEVAAMAPNDAKNAADTGERLRTETLVGYMLTDETGEWSTANKGRPINAAWLRDRLHDVVERANPRNNESTTRWYANNVRQRGYLRPQFEDAFARYLRVMPELAKARIPVRQFLPFTCRATAVQGPVQSTHPANGNGAAHPAKPRKPRTPKVKQPLPAEQPQATPKDATP